MSPYDTDVVVLEIKVAIEIKTKLGFNKGLANNVVAVWEVT
jgi:hypothetical protein